MIIYFWVSVAEKDRIVDWPKYNNNKNEDTGLNYIWNDNYDY